MFVALHAEVAKPSISRPDRPQTVESYDGQSVSASIGNNINTVTETTVTVYCPASGAPEPSTTWLKNGQAITEGERITIARNGSLSISEVQASDSGEYSCIARNIFGENTMTSTIRVAGTFCHVLYFRFFNQFRRFNP